jgi:hypothetical protein
LFFFFALWLKYLSAVHVDHMGRLHFLTAFC